jgi:chromosome segregation ATPase
MELTIMTTSTLSLNEAVLNTTLLVEYAKSPNDYPVFGVWKWGHTFVLVKKDTGKITQLFYRLCISLRLFELHGDPAFQNLRQKSIAVLNGVVNGFANVIPRVREASQLLGEAKAENSHLQAAVTALQVQNNALLRKAGELNTAVADLKKDNSTLHENYGNLDKDYIILHQNNANLDRDYGALQKELATKAEEIEALKRELQQKSEHYSNTMTIAQTATNKKDTSITNLNTQIANLNKQIEENKNSNTTLKKKIDEQTAESTQLRSDNSDLKNQLAKHLKESEAHVSSRKKFEEEKHKLNGEISKQLLQLTEKNEEQLKNIEKLAAEKASLEKTLKEHQNPVIDNSKMEEDEREKFHLELHEKNEELVKLHEELNSKDREITGLHEAVNKYDTQLKKFVGEIKGLEISANHWKDMYHNELEKPQDLHTMLTASTLEKRNEK